MAIAVPVLGRLSWREYTAVVLGFLFMLLEVLLRICTFLLPVRLLKYFYDLSARFVSEPKEKTMMHVIQTSPGFVEMCAAFGYEAQEHVVQTKDGYLLGMHRICLTRSELKARKQASMSHKRGRRPQKVQKPVIYLHHGLMMNSEVWVCNLEEERSLPFVLVERGYDVWFGNNRGNKYSKKHISKVASSSAFWDFCMDDFALRDIPDAIDYILDATNAPSLAYIGFSQGTAQAFATLSIHPLLNDKINLFIALAPAMSPKGLHNVLVNALIRSSPTALFLFFGRKAILPSTMFWQSVIYPPLYVKLLDSCMRFLFKWHSGNMTLQQKMASYYHLYSFASVKSLVHWFQVIRAGSFQMYDDDATVMPGKFYRAARFPTKNITAPIVLMYGGSDSLVEINVMLDALPDHTIAEEVPHYEHLDFLWARDVDKRVIPRVLHHLLEFAEPTSDERKGTEMPGESKSPFYDEDSGQSDSNSSTHNKRNSLGGLNVSKLISGSKSTPTTKLTQL